MACLLSILTFRSGCVCVCVCVGVCFVWSVLVCAWRVEGMRRAGDRCSLGHTGTPDAGGAHLCEHLVQPLQGPVQVHLDPAGGAGDVLAVVLCSPTLGRGGEGGGQGQAWS